MKYGTNPQMTGYDFGDAYNGIAWVEFGTNKDFVVCGSNLPGPNATFWFMRVADFENRRPAAPQPYKIESVQDKMFTTAKNLSGLGYDSTNRVLYAYEAAQNTVTIVHAWQVSEAGDEPPTPITDLAASNPNFYEHHADLERSAGRPRRGRQGGRLRRPLQHQPDHRGQLGQRRAGHGRTGAFGPGPARAVRRHGVDPRHALLLRRQVL